MSFINLNLFSHSTAPCPLFWEWVKSGWPYSVDSIESDISGEKIEVDCPEDRYILYEAEDAGLDVPWSCR